MVSAAALALPLAKVGEVGESFFHERTSETLPCQATEQALLLRLGEGKHRQLSGRRPCSTSNWSCSRSSSALRSPSPWRCSPTGDAGCGRRCLAATGVIYTVPSLAFFFLLLPITGLGRDTVIIALSAYTLQIIYRNAITGLANVPACVKDAARGMGLTDRQILWRVELPLATPEIVAGLRIATVSTVAIDPGVFARRRPRAKIYTGGGLTFKTNIIIAGGIAMLMAFAFDLILSDPALRDALAKAGGSDRRPPPPPAGLDRRRDRIHLRAAELERHRRQEGRRLLTGGRTDDHPARDDRVALRHLDPVALPIGLYLGHRGTGELLASAWQRRPGDPRAGADRLHGSGDRGRAAERDHRPRVLGVPPILTNAFVGIHQVDRASVDAARGIGMTEREILFKVEMPLAVPTLMAGIRGATIAIVATATIAPLAGVLTLGDFIINRNVYGASGLLAGAILVALLALALESLLAWLQRLLTSRGLRLSAA